MSLPVLLGLVCLSSGPVIGSFTVENIGTDGPSLVTGRPFKVSCLIISDTGSGPELVEVLSGNSSSTMYPKSGTVNWSQGVLYEGTLRLDDMGNHTVIISVKGEGTTVTFLYNLTMKEGAADHNGPTLLGLPRWYCALSIVFLTLLLMFITFAYFKGRTLQRTRMLKEGQSYEFCSSCGARTRSKDRVCPSCRKELVDSIELCGRCRTKVQNGSSKCPSCGVRLAENPS